MNEAVRITNMPDPGSREAVAFRLWQILRDAKASPSDQLRFYATCLSTVGGYPPAE